MGQLKCLRADLFMKYLGFPPYPFLRDVMAGENLQ